MNEDDIKLTPFEAFVLRKAHSGLNRMADDRWIAAQWPGYRRPAARGALVAHVNRAAYKLQRLGLVHRIPPKDQWGGAMVCCRDAGGRWLLDHPA